MVRERLRAASLRDYKERMLRVLLHIQQRLDEALPLTELARVACFSPYHFHRVFKGMLGEGVAEHVRRLRLERAATQLKTSCHSVTQIALDAGYETHEAFTRAFKDAFGLAPVVFRARRGAPTALAVPSRVHYREPPGVTRFRALRSGEPTMNVTLETIDPIRVAFVRHLGSYPTCGEAWDRFLPLLGSEGWLGPSTRFIGICHDDPDVTPPDKVRYDACITVDDAFRPAGEIGVQVIPGGLYARATHRGPYRRLERAYQRLFGQWLPRSGYELRSSFCFEVYLNDPSGTEPAELLTDIYLPLRARQEHYTWRHKSAAPGSGDPAYRDL